MRELRAEPSLLELCRGDAINRIKTNLQKKRSHGFVFLMCASCEYYKEASFQKNKKTKLILCISNKNHYLCVEIILVWEMKDLNRINIAYFVSFCIEQYKNAKHLTGAEAMRRLDEYNVLDYLSEHYEILHTQSRQWILEDIDEFIRLRKEKDV